MVHPQARREPAPSDVTDADTVQVEETPAVPVPRQQVREHPDAYDLYAQIYALRTERPEA
jgi:hypothetical protein